MKGDRREIARRLGDLRLGKQLFRHHRSHIRVRGVILAGKSRRRGYLQLDPSRHKDRARSRRITHFICIRLA